MDIDETGRPRGETSRVDQAAQDILGTRRHHNDTLCGREEAMTSSAAVVVDPVNQTAAVDDPVVNQLQKDSHSSPGTTSFLTR